MVIKSADLVWIVVADLGKAIQYYTEVLGLVLLSGDREMGWVELQGKEGGTMIGLAQSSAENPFKVGSNAVITFTVDDIEETCRDCQAKGLKLVGEIEEIPGHVKMQTCVDLDGNYFQIVQCLDQSACKGCF